jgi:RNA polymerase sigma factor (sigma-70 family)
MAASEVSEVIRHLRKTMLRSDGAGLTDAQLLEAYLSRREEAALVALVRRHAPMVWGVCRRLLPNHHDAEDAFQATFLVLVRKAASIASRELLANWLYGVAHQTARKARATAAKRKGRERQVTDMPEPAVTEQDLWSDLLPLLDQELSRLPEKYRAIIVLCDLEGKTRKEVARQLGLPEGTVASRMMRARTMLAKRLGRHGLAVSGGALAAVLSQQEALAGAPAAVVSSTIKAASLFAAGQAAAAAGVTSANALALAEGVLKIMLFNRLKVVAVTLLLIAVLGGGAVGLGRQTRVAGGDEPPMSVSSNANQDTQRDTGLSKFSKSRTEVAKTDGEKGPQADEGKDGKYALAGLEEDFDQDHPNSLDGLWEDLDHKGGWYRFHRNTIKWHPAPSQLSDLGRKQDRHEPVIEEWICRYKLTPTPMTIDLFLKKGTARGIFVVENDTLFIALAEKGKARPTSIQRDDATTLLVLKRVRPPQQKTDRDKDETAIAAFYERTGHPGAAAFYRLLAARKEQAKDKGKEEAKGKPTLAVHAVLERVDASNAVITAETLSGRAAESLLKLLSFVVSEKEPDKVTAAQTVERALRFVSKNHPKLVNIPVRSDARIMHGDKVLKLKDLQAGRVVSLQLAADESTGLAIVRIEVVDKKDKKKP